MNSVDRLDKALTLKHKNLTRASAIKLIRQGYVKVNKRLVTKPSATVKSTDILELDYNFSAQLPNLKLEIVFEDNDVIVINKPIGVLSHSKGALNPEATVASWLAAKYQGPLGERAGIVHRLDRATSGIMIVAKNEAAAKWLQTQFSQRKVVKTYLAIVSGHLKNEQAIIDLPIERNPKKPQTFRVGAGGKKATTKYRVLAQNDRFSLVEVHPTTGRTHQIRVHLAHLGHPIVGDTMYRGQAADRLYLHAKSLEITSPSKKILSLTVKEPKEFKQLLKS